MFSWRSILVISINIFEYCANHYFREINNTEIAICATRCEMGLFSALDVESSIEARPCAEIPDFTTCCTQDFLLRCESGPFYSFFSWLFIWQSKSSTWSDVLLHSQCDEINYFYAPKCIKLILTH